MSNWLQNIFGGSGEQKRNLSREPELHKSEFKPTQLPPRRGEVPQMVDEAFELNRFELQVSPHEFRFALARESDGLIAFKRNKKLTSVTLNRHLALYTFFFRNTKSWTLRLICLKRFFKKPQFLSHQCICDFNDASYEDRLQK